MFTNKYLIRWSAAETNGKTKTVEYSDVRTQGKKHSEKR